MTTIKRDNAVVVKRGGSNLLEKYKNQIGKKEDFLEYQVRGAKAQKLTEIAEVVKYLSRTDATKDFQIPQSDFEKAYGPGSRGINYVKAYLKKFGIPQPRVMPSQDVVHIWSKSPIK